MFSMSLTMFTRLKDTRGPKQLGKTSVRMASEGRALGLGRFSFYVAVTVEVCTSRLKFSHSLVQVGD